MEKSIDVAVDATYTAQTLDDDLKKLDITFESTATKRANLVDKLEPIVMSMDISTEVVDRDSAAALDSKINVVNTYMSLLNDEDKAIKTKIDVKAKQKELLDTGKMAEAFIASVVDANKKRLEKKQNMPAVMEKADVELQSRIESDAIIISEGELRTDPTDLH